MAEPLPNLNEPIIGTQTANLRWWRWFQFVNSVLGPGGGTYSGTVVTAPLTSGGTPGSIVFKSGVVVAHTQAT